MLFRDYLASLTEPLSERTLGFLFESDGSRMLLGRKKKGFGEDYYTGIGGKIEKDETIEEAAVREFQEEVIVTPNGLREVGELTFLFLERPQSWNQRVYVFRTNSWEGTPTETEEIKPYWFDVDDLPYSVMWDDAKAWMPYMLEGWRLKGEFLFDRELKVCCGKVTPVSKEQSLLR